MAGNFFTIKTNFKCNTILFLVLVGFTVRSQVPYTTNQFTSDSLPNVVYGTAVNYAGNTDTLKMDIYKPIGDFNCLRPLIVLIHGGSWISGSKEDYNMVAMAHDFAEKGWVAATINYRLGTHKASNYSMYAVCNNSISQPCAYICDSAEVFRAIFRGMQDAKGAIRYLKSRNIADSTDINNVFIAGESAGGFISLAAAFTDQIGEKNNSCSAITDAPNPDADLNNYGCIPAANNLSRPDLGSIYGDLNLGMYDATVKGAGSLYGGVTDLSLFQQNNDTPCVYLFHQGSDVVVHFNYGDILGRISWECYAQTNICQSYYFYPGAYGGEGIRQYFVALGSAAPVYQAEIIYNYNYLNNCLSNGHAVDNLPLRSQQMADLFAAKIAQSGNNPQWNCIPIGLSESSNAQPLILYPTCSDGFFTFKVDEKFTGAVYHLYNNLGAEVATGKLKQYNIIDALDLSKGLFLLKIEIKNTQTVKILIN